MIYIAAEAWYHAHFWSSWSSPSVRDVCNVRQSSVWSVPAVKRKCTCFIREVIWLRERCTFVILSCKLRSKIHLKLLKLCAVLFAVSSNLFSSGLLTKIVTNLFFLSLLCLLDWTDKLLLHNGEPGCLVFVSRIGVQFQHSGLFFIVCGA